MKILSFENFLKSHNVDIYDFISYIDDTQFDINNFKDIYNEVIINHRVNDDIPIQISKKYIKNNINLYKKYYFDKLHPSKWIIKAFTFGNRVLNIKEDRWYNMHTDWQMEVKNHKRIIIFNPRQKSNIQKYKNIKI